MAKNKKIKSITSYLQLHVLPTPLYLLIMFQVVFSRSQSWLQIRGLWGVVKDYGYLGPQPNKSKSLGQEPGPGSFFLKLPVNAALQSGQRALDLPLLRRGVLLPG